MDIETIKQIREKTGAGVMDVKKALDEARGDIDKAKEILKAKGMERAHKKSEREIKSGRVFSYVHGEGKIGVLVKLGCETDFVAKNEEFIRLGQELCLQVSAMNPLDIEEFLEQDYIRDPKKKVSELIKELVAKVGENITVVEISRIEV